MIALTGTIVKSLTQKSYDDTVKKNILYSRCHCFCKGCNGYYVAHSHYKRHVKFGSQDLILSVLVVICNECGKTHAVLLDCMVPYHQLLLSIQIEIIETAEMKDDDAKKHFWKVIEENRQVLSSESALRILQNYKKLWKEKLRHLHIGLDDPGLTEACCTAYSLQFMQVRSVPCHFLGAK